MVGQLALLTDPGVAANGDSRQTDRHAQQHREPGWAHEQFDEPAVDDGRDERAKRRAKPHDDMVSQYVSQDHRLTLPKGT